MNSLTSWPFRVFDIHVCENKGNEYQILQDMIAVVYALNLTSHRYNLQWHHVTDNPEIIIISSNISLNVWDLDNL